MEPPTCAKIRPDLFCARLMPEVSRRYAECAFEALREVRSIAKTEYLRDFGVVQSPLLNECFRSIDLGVSTINGHRLSRKGTEFFPKVIF